MTTQIFFLFTLEEEKIFKQKCEEMVEHPHFLLTRLLTKKLKDFETELAETGKITIHIKHPLNNYDRRDPEIYSQSIKIFPDLRTELKKYIAYTGLTQQSLLRLIVAEFLYDSM